MNSYTSFSVLTLLVTSFWLLRESLIDFKTKEFVFAVTSVFASAICFIWVYEGYYQHTGDVFSFLEEYRRFGEGTISETLIRQPRVKWFVWSSYPLYVLGGESLLGTASWFALLSILTKWMFYQSYKDIFGLNRRVLLIVLFAIPSFSFWSSGITKESFVISLLLLGFVLFKEVKSPLKILSIAVIFLSLQVKPYIVILLYLVLVIKELLGYKKKSQMIGAVLVLVLSLFFAWSAFPLFSPMHILETLQLNAKASLDLSGLSNVDLNKWGSSLFMKGLYALVTGLFRPFVLEGNSLLVIIQGLEKGLLSVLGVIFLFKVKWSLPKMLNFLLLAWVIGLSIVLVLSSPNLGTISRYSVYYIPVLVYFFLANLSLSKTELQSSNNSSATDHGEIHQPTFKKK